MRRTSAILWAVAAVAATALGWMDVRQRARLDRGLSRHRTDFTVYTAASEALFTGGDPYEAKSPRGWRYVYPPLLAIVVRPLTALDVPDAAFVWYAISVLALAAAAIGLVRAIGPPTGRRAVAGALVLAAGFLLQTFQRGQVTTLLLALQVGALLALLRGRDALAGLLLAVGIALRLTPALPAAMVGLACVRRLLRGEARAALRFPAGLLAGLVLAFVALPVAALGPSRAREVTARWLAVGRDVYASRPGELADLGRDYDVNEWSFKNQGVRRVAGTWAAWTTGAPIDETGRPALGATLAAVDLAALAVAGLAAVLAIMLGWRDLLDRASPRFRRAYAVGVLLPVLGTRYAWPIHYVVAIPLLAEALAGAPRPWARTSVAVFLAGTAAFYLAHLPGLHAPAEAGVLLGATVVALGLALARREAVP